MLFRAAVFGLGLLFRACGIWTAREKWGRAWWYVSIIPALREVEAGGYKFKLSLGNLARMCFKKLKEAEGEGNI